MKKQFLIIMCLFIFSFLNASSIIGSYNTTDKIFDMHLKDNYIYIVYGLNGFRIIDISNPYMPVEKAFYNDSTLAFGITVSSNRAYIAGLGGLLIMDVSDIENPKKIDFTSGFSTYTGNYRVSLKDGYLFIANYGLDIASIKNEDSVEYINFCLNRELCDEWRMRETYGINDIAVLDNYLYAAGAYECSGDNYMKINNYKFAVQMYYKSGDAYFDHGFEAEALLMYEKAADLYYE